MSLANCKKSESSRSVQNVVCRCVKFRAKTVYCNIWHLFSKWYIDLTKHQMKLDVEINLLPHILTIRTKFRENIYNDSNLKNIKTVLHWNIIAWCNPLLSRCFVSPIHLFIYFIVFHLHLFALNNTSTTKITIKHFVFVEIVYCSSVSSFYWVCFVESNRFFNSSLFGITRAISYAYKLYHSRKE